MHTACFEHNLLNSRISSMWKRIAHNNLIIYDKDFKNIKRETCLLHHRGWVIITIQSAQSKLTRCEQHRRTGVQTGDFQAWPISRCRYPGASTFFLWKKWCVIISVSFYEESEALSSISHHRSSIPMFLLPLKIWFERWVKICQKNKL